MCFISSKIWVLKPIEVLHNSFINNRLRKKLKVKKVANRIFRNKRALSPVIATVVLVAVTIVVAVAVSYWMGGIAGLYTRFEKIEITSHYAVKNADGNYTITVTLKNSGSQDASITSVLINGKPYEQYNENETFITVSWTVEGRGDNQPLTSGNPMPIPLGQSGTVTIWIDGDLWESGTTVDIKFHSAAGKDYPVMLPLP